MACSSAPSNRFTLEGSVIGAKDSDNIILYYYILKNNEWQEIADTTKIINGKFVFEGKIDDLTAGELVFDNPNSNVKFDTRIYMEPTKMKLHIDKNQLYTYSLSGTKVEKENLELRKEIISDEKKSDDYLKCIDNLIEQINLNYDNIPVRDSLIDILTQSRAEYKAGYKEDKKYLEFIQKHNNYKIVPDLLYLLSRTDSIPFLDTLKSIYNNIPEQSRNSLMGKLAYLQIEYQEQQLAQIKDTAVGNISPNFTKKDVYGNIINLSDYRNKDFVLLDFWASWCMPCLEAIPKIKDLFSKYGKKELVFISISLDTDSVKWTEAIQKYQLDEWTQTMDVVKRNNNPDSNFNQDNLYNIYNVKTIPNYLLINKNGVIIANCNDIENLEIELHKILN